LVWEVNTFVGVVRDSEVETVNNVLEGAHLRMGGDSMEHKLGDGEFLSEIFGGTEEPS